MPVGGGLLFIELAQRRELLLESRLAFKNIPCRGQPTFGGMETLGKPGISVPLSGGMRSGSRAQAAGQCHRTQRELQLAFHMLVFGSATLKPWSLGGGESPSWSWHHVAA